MQFKVPQLLTLLDNTDMGFYVIDEHGSIQFANNAFLDILAVPSLEDIQNRSIFTWVPEDYREEFKIFISEVITSGINKDYECTISATDRKKIDLKQSATKENSPEGVFIFVLAKNITVQNAAMHRLKDAKDKAEESNRLKTAFLANLSHEVRTPMNAIMGFSELLLSENIPPSHKEKYINYINNSGAVLLNLIDDIIDIAKMQAGQLAIKKIKCDLSTLMYDLYSSYAQLTKSQKGDAVKLNCINPDTRNQIKFNTDPLRLRQIFTNLLSHSLKYTDTGTITFGYNYHDVLAGKPLQFFVHDTGIGLSGDSKQLVFDRFYKVEDDNLKFYRGAGLGLTISKNLVTLLGGEIWVDSEPGVGSKFYFQFPVADVIISNDQKYVASKEVDYRILDGKTILVAEDEDINFIYIDELLKKHGVDIIHARNGQDAVDLFKENQKIDLVLMDIKMPIMDGYEATRIIKELNPSIPIIAQTAYALAGEKDKIIEAGCDDYLSKPIKPVSMFKLLTQFLEKQQ